MVEQLPALAQERFSICGAAEAPEDEEFSTTEAQETHHPR
jgi:hypothetical protein